MPAAPATPPSLPPPELFAASLPDLTAGMLLSRAFSVWWKNVFRFAVVTLLALVLPLAALGLAAAWFPARVGTGEEVGASMSEVLLVGMLPVLGIGLAIQVAALTSGAVQHLGGRPVRLGAMLAAGFRRAIPLAVVAVLSGLMVLAGFVLLVVPGVMIACAVGVAIPAAVVERLGPVAAIRRSFELTRDYRFPVFGASFVMGIVGAVADAVFGQLLPAVLPAGMASVASFVAPVLNLLVAALPTVVPAVAYHALRTIKEGAAGADLARVFE